MAKRLQPPQNTPPTDAQIDAQIARARARSAQYEAAGLYASAARYDRTSRRLVLELTNGYSLGIPVSTLPHLHEATAAQLTAVELSSEGMTLRIPALDADYSVPGLVLSMSAKEIGRKGGQATSKQKKRASRTNGLKGGRPRKTTSS